MHRARLPTVTQTLSPKCSLGEGGCSNGCYLSKQHVSIIDLRWSSQTQCLSVVAGILHTNNSAPVVRVLTAVQNQNKFRGKLRLGVLFTEKRSLDHKLRQQVPRPLSFRGCTSHTEHLAHQFIVALHLTSCD